MRFSVYIACPLVLSLSNVELHRILAVKNICKEEKFIPRLTFKPGLALNNGLSNNPALTD